jgi:hypothetical protein
VLQVCITNWKSGGSNSDRACILFHAIFPNLFLLKWVFKISTHIKFGLVLLTTNWEWIKTWRWHAEWVMCSRPQTNSSSVFRSWLRSCYDTQSQLLKSEWGVRVLKLQLYVDLLGDSTCCSFYVTSSFKSCCENIWSATFRMRGQTMQAIVNQGGNYIWFMYEGRRLFYGTRLLTGY